MYKFGACLKITNNKRFVVSFRESLFIFFFFLKKKRFCKLSSLTKNLTSSHSRTNQLCVIFYSSLFLNDVHLQNIDCTCVTLRPQVLVIELTQKLFVAHFPSASRSTVCFVESAFHSINVMNGCLSSFPFSRQWLSVMPLEHSRTSTMKLFFVKIVNA